MNQANRTSADGGYADWTYDIKELVSLLKNDRHWPNNEVDKVRRRINVTQHPDLKRVVEWYIVNNEIAWARSGLVSYQLSTSGYDMDLIQQVSSTALYLDQVLKEPLTIGNLTEYAKDLLVIDNSIIMYRGVVMVLQYIEIVDKCVWLCGTCASIQRETVGQTGVYNAMGGSAAVRAICSRPHKCTLSGLMMVDGLWRAGLMERSAYELWLRANSYNYMTGADAKTMILWDERKVKLDEVMLSEKPSLTSSVIFPYKCPIHGSWHVKVRWTPGGKRSLYKPLNDIFPYSSSADKAHTNLDVATVVYNVLSTTQVLLEHRKIDQCLAIIPVGTYNITVTAMLIHAIGNPTWDKIYQMVAEDRACCLSLAAYKSYWKGVSTAIRRTSRWPNGSSASLTEVTTTAYFELPIGRSINISNWQQEIVNRTQKTIPLRDVTKEATTRRDESTNMEYLQRLGVELAETMKQLVPPRERWPSWKQFVESRQAWSSSGSAGNKKWMVDGQEVRVNKHSYFETQPTAEMLRWIETRPTIKATASEKFEMGKARAIYGTGVVDYTIVSHVIAGIEPKLNRVDGIEGGLSGFDEIQCIRRKAATTSSGNTECTMVDYADFNKQHTLQAQQAVFAALLDRMVEIGAHPDAIRSAQWCVEAHGNQWCAFPASAPDTPDQRIVQGMFSGNRATNFLNTLLNLAYYRVASKQAEEMFNLAPIAEYHVHQGDDVWVTNKSRPWAIALYNVMQATGFEFQASKQLFDVDRGEFLRVMYSQEGAMGYLARAVGTLIMNPVQNPVVYNPVDKAVAQNSQLCVLMRRGLSREACWLLWKLMVKHGLRNRKPGGGGVTVPVQAVTKSFKDGGLDLGPPGSMSTPSVTIPRLPQMMLWTSDLESAIPMHMSLDWIRVMSERYGTSFDAPAVLSMLHRSNVSDSLREVDRVKAVRAWEKKMTDWECKYRAAGSSVVTRSDVEIQDYMGQAHTGKLNTLLLVMSARPEKKSGWWDKTSVELIMQAISQTSFRDISTIKAATHVNTLEAATIGISACSELGMQKRAFQELEFLKSKLPTEILERVLDGVRGAGAPYEAIFHPICLSWMSRTATATALSIACFERVKKVEEWDKLLDYWHQAMMSFGYHVLRLHEISKY